MSGAEPLPEDASPDLAPDLRRMSGLEIVRALADGRVQHTAHQEHIGLRVTSVEAGRVELLWAPHGGLVNRSGIVHGGYLAMVLDDACGIACASAREAFAPSITLHLSLEFLRAARAGHEYLVVGTVLKRGRTRDVAEGVVYDSHGERIAVGTASIVPNRGLAPG